MYSTSHLIQKRFLTDKIVIFLLFLFLLALSNSLSANETRVEFRAAAFLPSSNLFREIYGKVGANYQIEATRSFNAHLDTWANFDWFSKHGKSHGFNDSTRVNIANFSLGVKFPYRFSQQFIGYVGIGPNFSTIWVKNKSHCGHSNASKFGVGGVVKTGVNFFFNQRFFLDVFVDYLYQPVHFDRNVNIGGFKIGAGIGYKF